MDPHENLFVRVPKLELPAVLKEYLLFDQKLQKRESDDTKDDERNNDNHYDVFVYPSLEILLSHSAWM